MTTAKPMDTSHLARVWPFCETVANDKILSTKKFDQLKPE